MKMASFKFLIVTAAMSVAAAAYSAPQKYSYGQETTIAIREMRASIDEMRHEMNNHETEIRTFEEKLANQEVIIEALREQNITLTKAAEEASKSNIANLEMKTNSLDTATKGLLSDFRELKAHANKSSGAITLFQQKIVEIEKAIEIQGHNIENLQTALRSLANILEIKLEVKPPVKPEVKPEGKADLSTSDEGKSKVYRVQAGDSLEKIAKAYKVTIKAIKELNDLTTDRIIVGQNIKIP